MKVPNFPELERLRGLFQAERIADVQLDVRYVGGCVRDMILDRQPKDIDLCTNATPEEQIAIYHKHGIRYIETGRAHGTITVVLDGQTFEITSLRTESDHDGRHAVVAYTRDWIEDLSRRDLTFNAMALDFDGKLYDPFGGEADLKAGRVRFVGDPAERMQEDYLRILRWLRFHQRFGKDFLDQDAVDAAILFGSGLKQISRERIWMEMSKIMAGSGTAYILRSIMRMGLAPHMDMPHGSIREFSRAQMSGVDCPVSRMVAFVIDPVRVRKLAADWKWSREEADKATFLADHLMDDELDLMRMMAVDGYRQDWVIDLSILQTDPTDPNKNRFNRKLERAVPVFPVKGQDLLEQGMKPGKQIGEQLAVLKEVWAMSGYQMSKDQLLETIFVGAAQ